MIRQTDRRLKLVIGALFILATLSVTVLLVGYEKPGGRRMGFVDALFCMDFLYDVENGIFAKGAGGVVEAVTVTVAGISVTVLRWSRTRRGECSALRDQRDHRVEGGERHRL